MVSLFRSGWLNNNVPPFIVYNWIHYGVYYYHDLIYQANSIFGLICTEINISTFNFFPVSLNAVLSCSFRVREEIAHCNTIILYLFMPFIFQQCSVNEKEDHIASIGKDLSQEIRFSFQFDTILWLHRPWLKRYE